VYDKLLKPRHSFLITLYRHTPDYAISDLRQLKKKGKELNNIIETCSENFLAVMKALQDEGGGRILPGDDKGSGRSCCGRLDSNVLEFGF